MKRSVILLVVSVGCGAPSRVPPDATGSGSGSGSGETFYDAAPADQAVGMPRTINFDDLATGAAVTTQYSGVTFSTPDTSRINLTSNASGANYGQSMPNFLCTGPAGSSGVDCTTETDISFAKPVDHLTFHAIEANNPGTVATVQVYVMGSLAGTVNITGLNTTMAPPVVVDLSQYSHVTKIAIGNINDGGGIGWDDFSFVE